MPIDVATPDWQCQSCRTRFGEDLAAAQRCESAPIPDLLPEGTPVLDYSLGASRFILTPLKQTTRVVSDATRFNDRSGHHRCYLVGTSVNAGTITDADLIPGTDGHLQIRRRHGIITDRLYAPEEPAESVAQWFGLLNLGQPGAKATEWEGRSSVVVADPITDEVRNVLDTFEPELDDWHRKDRFRHPSARQQLLEGYALFLGRGDQLTANSILATHAHDQLIEECLARQRAWFAGEQVSTPLSGALWRRCRVQKTFSKLTKSERAIVAAAGVPWPARTDSDEYIRKLLREKLMHSISVESTRLFPLARTVIGVGGGKGGVGKSTVAAALALALAAAGLTVTLVDLDLNGPSQHILFALGAPQIDATNTRLQPTQARAGLRVFSPGQIVEGLPTFWTAAQRDSWLTFLQGTLDIDDIVIVDLPAGWQPEVDANVVVTTAHPLAIADTRRRLPAALGREFNQRSCPAFLVENMSEARGTAPDGTTTTVRILGEAGAVEQLTVNGGTYCGSLPWNPDLDALAASEPLQQLTQKITRLHSAVETATGI
ncbi:P-loop NTPase [Mycobacteroides abscessus]|uniref:P-loop NTPase n=1 Tax=Mycobacteroides abscessus TaxID=36809 RepID=UPI00272C979A|nr:P-loop NTPase [Mycobacteroides abscessus]